MAGPNTVAIELRFDRRDDGRYHIYSPDLPGLHLAGMDLDALRGDFQSAIRDLIDANVKIPIERLHFFPNLAGISGVGPIGTKRETCIVSFLKGS